MTFLLDTNLIVWLAFTPGRVSSKIHQLIDGNSDVALSIVSRWELGIKAKSGRFPHLASLDAAIEAWSMSMLPISMSHVRLAADLKLIHKDPFDRLLVAQAMVEGRTLITADRLLAAYDVRTIVA